MIDLLIIFPSPRAVSLDQEKYKLWNDDVFRDVKFVTPGSARTDELWLLAVSSKSVSRHKKRGWFRNNDRSFLSYAKYNPLGDRSLSYSCWMKNDSTWKELFEIGNESMHESKSRLA